MANISSDNKMTISTADNVFVYKIYNNNLNSGKCVFVYASDDSINTDVT